MCHILFRVTGSENCRPFVVVVFAVVVVVVVVLFIVLFVCFC